MTGRSPRSRRPVATGATGAIGALWLLTSVIACDDRAVAPPDGHTRPSVLLITIDTLRADYLGAYDPSVSSTPRLDRLARSAMVFDRASTPMPMTRPAHFSILTSLYPREHGVMNNVLSLPESATTLAETLRDAGYRTGGFVAVSLLSRDAGAAQGFDEFESPPSKDRQRKGEEVVKRAVEFMAADDGPFFLWVHLFDPHLPYGPPEGYRDHLAPEFASSLPDLNWRELKQIAAKHDGDIPLDILNHAKALYRGEVSYVDHWVGELLDALDSVRSPEQTIVAFTADHGECFEDGVYFEHADCLNEGALRIPLIVRHSDFAPGSHFDGQVSAIDIAPTILRSAKLEIPPHYSGRPLQNQDEGEDRYVLLQHPFYQEKTAGGRTRRHSVIRSVAGEPIKRILVDEDRVGIIGRSWKLIQDGDALELFSLSPPAAAGTSSEQPRDIDSHTLVTETLRAKLSEQLDRYDMTILDPTQINQELRDTLRALGYLDEVESEAEAESEAEPSAGS